MEVSLDHVSVDLRQVLFEMACALDAVGVDDIHHGHRVAYIAYRCAQRMGWSEEKAQIAFSLGLIHDCGVTEATERSALLESLVPKDTISHCVKGYELLRACKPLESLAVPILYHHTWWSELAQTEGISEEDKQFAALLFISDRVDYLHANYCPDSYGNVTQSSREVITQELLANAWTMFDANHVQHMVELIDSDDFWFSMDSRYIENLAYRFDAVPFFSTHLTLEETISVAELFAQIVDAKSSFTFEHSRNVAKLTEFLGLQLGYSHRVQRMLYLAGLVHDIGKLKTPVAILHKPQALTEEEYVCIRRHATDTRHALIKMFHCQEVIDWASNHHERLDGSGYPMGKTAEQLDQPSRIVAIADVFQALTQSRPYRKGLMLSKAMCILNELVEKGQLDEKVYGCLRHHARRCYNISTGLDELATAHQ
ncbi:HD-GYP domain-containing protein [Vibrio sp. 16]|uniref:HD-GYP domain-containing protein n=1 Tax=Vibrio sp. 16 TaxID=391586 RepID=UPI00018F35B0|nr:HD domain-containing protein [Vibrio sp. 16]EED28543.1 metal dependent phosphohydrolase [Vibrio sp. 16]CAK4075071.1 3'3'-cGAMP-specific phosphodiesterase 1 [Vibrio sp. 16]